MSTLAIELSEEKVMKLIKDSLKLSIVQEYLNTKKEEEYMNVEVIRKIIKAE